MQSYQAHTAGQKHKKKVAAGELARMAVGVPGTQALFCELCNVSCSGHEVMRTHVNGARHKKVLHNHAHTHTPV